MLYVTGDTHGDYERFTSSALKKLKKGDTLFICGDFGFIWDGSKNEEKLLKKIGKLKYNVCFIDGTHENFERLRSYEVSEFKGGKVHHITGNLYHLMRGQTYDFDGVSVFAMGGGESPDIDIRSDLNSWSGDEIPTEAELTEGAQNLKKLGTKVAVIWKNDDVYSTGIHDKFVAEGKAKGLEIVSDMTFTDSSANDFSVQLNDAKSKGAELVFLPIYYQPASLILKQAHDMGFDTTFFGVDGMDGILTLEGFDTSLAEGLMLMTPFNADSTEEKTAAFVKKYQEQFGETPNQFAADAYDCVYAYKQALENAGATPDMSAEDLCDKMIEQFTSMTFDGLTGTGATWSAEGAVTKDPTVVKIADGKYVDV